jgi:hypothetical protein
MGRSVAMNTLTVADTSSGSVASGMATAVTLIQESIKYLSTDAPDMTDLVNELTAMVIARDEYLSPKLETTTLHQVASLMFEHGISIHDADELLIAEAFRIGDVRKVWITGLAVFTNNQGLV